MVYRMCALREFKNIPKSNLDHFIEHEGILNYEGDCWGQYHINGRGFIENGRVWADVIVCVMLLLAWTFVLMIARRYIVCCLSLALFMGIIIHKYIVLEWGSRLYVCNKIKIYCRLKVSGNAHVDGYALVYN